ncbi:MAG TPA: hypothetical protein VI278_07920 [Nitrososphaeraceae archaeon]
MGVFETGSRQYIIGCYREGMEVSKDLDYEEHNFAESHKRQT